MTVQGQAVIDNRWMLGSTMLKLWMGFHQARNDKELSGLDKYKINFKMYTL